MEKKLFTANAVSYSPAQSVALYPSTCEAHIIFLVKQSQQGCQLDWVGMEKEPGEKAQKMTLSAQM